ncbi:helix-turn-helix domain-containing protein [Piscinibacter defluvii]|uniref:helix-turn-helix domain-containing protein n=1 Tax=Piscinibacter defluvii TaxID=1796922 RepID=UPI000FDEA1F2|nr:helix-turn-helix domain-containing protein [Piscinibacter defluvii]
MSFDAIAWAFQQDCGNSSGKLLLLTLANLVRPPRFEAFASAGTLAALTHLDRKTVLSTLTKLEQRGLIARKDVKTGSTPTFQLVGWTVGEERGSGPGESIESESDPENGSASPRASSAQPIPEFPATSTSFPADPSQNSHGPVPISGHITSTEPVSEPAVEPVTRATRYARTANDAARFIDFWASWPATDRKQDRKACLEHWRKHRLDEVADQIVAHVIASKGTQKWLDGYEPAPKTYLRNRRWEDGTPVSAAEMRERIKAEERARLTAEGLRILQRGNSSVLDIVAREVEK